MISSNLSSRFFGRDIPTRESSLSIVISLNLVSIRFSYDMFNLSFMYAYVVLLFREHTEKSRIPGTDLREFSVRVQPDRFV
jgi:hypothetical protein